MLDAGPGRNNWIYGGSGNYKIDGAHYTDCSATSDSNDWLTCGTGDDTVYGGPGNEVITGGSGTDELFGGIGTNEIHSGTGTNYLCPGGQNDVLDGKLGTSTISTDTFSGASVQVQTPVWDFGSQGWVVNNYSNPDGPATSQGLVLDAGQNGSVYISGEEASGFPWQFSVDSGRAWAKMRRRRWPCTSAGTQAIRFGSGTTGPPTPNTRFTMAARCWPLWM